LSGQSFVTGHALNIYLSIGHTIGVWAAGCLGLGHIHCAYPPRQSISRVQVMLWEPWAAQATFLNMQLRSRSTRLRATGKQVVL
jgi:hypothetical protein